MSLRDQMPEVTAFIDEMREVFGREAVDRWIKAGMKVGGFWAQENGHEIGKKLEGEWWRRPWVD